MDTNKNFDLYKADLKHSQKIPLSSSFVVAGFPSPAEDHIEQSLDLNQYLITHPSATFFVKVEGKSMQDANIHPGDILIVDRSLNVQNKNIVIAIINGEFTVKRIRLNNNKIFLEAQNPSYPLIEIQKDWDFSIWGVVTYIIHKAQ